ncbi:hypothetical protein JCM8097_001953 [Rhodosporidiobolus ruineniae]
MQHPDSPNSSSRRSHSPPASTPATSDERHGAEAVGGSVEEAGLAKKRCKSRHIPTCKHCERRCEPCEYAEEDLPGAVDEGNSAVVGQGEAVDEDSRGSLNSEPVLPQADPSAGSSALVSSPLEQVALAALAGHLPPLPLHPAHDAHAASQPFLQVHPSFPRPEPSEENRQLRVSREALCRVLTHGIEAHVEQVKLEGVDAPGLFAELLNCDSRYSPYTSTALLTPLLSASSVPVPLPTPHQSHACLAAYFASVEPSLKLFASSSGRTAETFQAQCLALWNGHPGPEGEGGMRGRGWTGMYLAAVALGAVALREEQVRALGIVGGGERVETRAREWAGEAVRSLATDGFRASLLLLHFDLGGLTGIPDVPKILAVLPLLRAAAYELELQKESAEAVTREEREERRGLWERFSEVEAAWSPLLGQRLSLDPAFISAQPTPPSFAFPSPVSPTSTALDGAPPLRAVLLLSARLTHLLNCPYPSSPIDLALLSDQYVKVKRMLDEHVAVGEEGGNDLARVLLRAVFFRLRAAADEAGAVATVEEEQEWEREANELFNDVDLVFRCDRFQQLVALTAFLHSLILVALRLRRSTSPFRSTLAAGLAHVAASLKDWSMSNLLTRIAHNPRVSLAPRDLKGVQDIITSEKRLVDAQQRTAVERDRASMALKDWGHAEGPDLGDVLTKVYTLYDWLAKAEVSFCEHSGNSRLKFKEIRSKEEALSALKKTRDSLAGRIEAAERKVSKMKEENKDLPNAKQRLRDMQQEMIGLENSVLTEETALGDFKRSATREALSLKLGALLELAEKTVIVAELGKLIVDMLPTEPTQPGEQRAYYDGYQRTEELLGEASRCLQDVVFNPSPISEPFAQQSFGEGESHPKNQFDAATVGQEQQQYDQQQANEYGEHQYASYQDQTYGSQHQQTPHSYASPQGQSFTSPQAQSFTSPGQPQSPYDQGSFRRNSKRLSQTLPEQPLPHSGPQLQPLPDFRPLSVMTPPANDSSRQLGQQHQQSLDVGATPQVDGYASRSPGLAPPVGYEQNRTSLAYLGEAPPSEPGHGQQEETVEEREAREAYEDEQRAQERELRERQEYEAEQRRQREEQGGQYTYPTYEHPTTSSAGGNGIVSHDYQHDDGSESESLAVPVGGLNPLSPIQEVPTPAMTYVEDSPQPQQQPYEYQPLREAARSAPQQQQQPSSALQSRPSIEFVRPPSSADKRVQYGEEAAQQSYTPPPSASAQSTSYPNQGLTSPAPTSPVAAAPPSAVSTAAPSYHTSIPAPPTSSFEPRPLTPKGERHPVQIRPHGESALGSKHGDLYVPNSPGGARGEGTSYFAGGASGGATDGSTTPGGGAKRTVPAGAFRRPVGGGAGLPPGAGVGPGARGFAPSGYGAGQAEPHPTLHRSGPSESELIAEAYRTSNIPLSPGQQFASDAEVHAQIAGQLAQAGEGELPTTPTPSFDTRPLQVNKGGPAGKPLAGSVGRSGTLPSHLNTSHPVYDAHATTAAPSSPGLPYDQPGSPAVPYSPPPPSSQGAQQQPLSPSSQEGFGSNRFVTRLD